MIPDSTFWPEGADYDPRTGRYYVASVRHRTIAEVSADAKHRTDSGTIARPQLADRAVRADEPTIGTLAGGSFVYVANSQWEKHDDAGARTAGTKLTAPLLLAVPLP